MTSLPQPRPIDERSAIAPEQFDALTSRYEPIVLRGQAARWPAVQAAIHSDEALVEHLAGFDRGRPAEVLVGPPESDGRFFYDAAMRGCNFQKRQAPLTGLLRHLLAIRNDVAPPGLYAGAAAAAAHLPGWAEANPFPFDVPHAVPRVWVGNRTHVATHFDESSNVAIVVAGRRRFTVFPPEQFENLYVGPFRFTIAGPPVSMVDLRRPDIARYPRFVEALRHARTAVLHPGDAIYIPPIWWHDVQALDPLNVLMNYWWEGPNSISPLGTLLQAIGAMRDLPAAHRQAWRRWFDRYVFDDDAAQATDHLPPHVRNHVNESSNDKVMGRSQPSTVSRRPIVSTQTK